METISRSAATGIIRFGTFEVNVGSGELRKRGLRIALQEQPLRILIALLDRPGDVVGREELCQRLWPHGTFVDFEHSLNAAVRRLRVALGDDADVPRFVETVHKRGYRFLTLGPPARDNSEGHGRAAPATIAHIVRNRARLAVLPFGPYDGFTDGLTEEAMTQLTQACPRTIGVIARTSVERAQREGGGAAEIGRALSADYLVEGHVRRDGDRVRITAQLIESQEETHVWAITYDRVMTDALSLQVEVAVEIAKAVTDALSDSTGASA
ncbi:MAG TPA: winged helix-turn-helix domain-containing protein [Vicinamibacterales bacterium]